MTPITVLTTETIVARPNPRRKSLLLQNVGTNPIYIKKGNPNNISVPSLTNYDFALAAGTVANDGKGGSLSIKSSAGISAVAVGGSSSLSIMEIIIK